jgi:hypothetical protein
VADHTQVGDTGALGREQTVTDTRRVDLDAEKVLLWVSRGHFHQQLAIAETDLHHPWCRPAKDLVEID